jgi:hypothetical protein
MSLYLSEPMGIAARLLDSCLYSPAIPRVFLSIEKVGCSSLKRWLIGMTEPATLSRPSLRIHPYARERFSLSRLPAQEAADILASTPILAFVRDPIDRLRSGFIEKFVYVSSDELIPPARDLLAFAGQPPSRGLSFREFVRFVGTQRPERLDPHWRPQHAFFEGLPLRNLSIMPLERMNEVLYSIACEHDRPDCLTPALNITDKTPARRGILADMLSSDLYREQLRPPREELVDDDIVSLVREKFAPDFALHADACGRALAGSFASP